MVEASVILARGPVLTRADLALDSGERRPEPTGVRIPPGMTLADLEKEIFRQSLDRAGGNRTEVARELAVSLRTVQRKIRDYGWDDGGDNGGECAADGSRETERR